MFSRGAQGVCQQITEEPVAPDVSKTKVKM